MSKIFRQLKNAYFPVFLIISLLLNFTLYGFLFNLNVDQLSQAKLSLGKMAQASTTSQTQVTIRNDAPHFSNAPYVGETVASGSTTPINVGGSISFTLPANGAYDAESNDIKLLICDGSATATTSGGVQCLGGVQFCVSGWASTTPSTSSSTSCTLSSVTDLGSETQNWRAYVCDNHPSQPGCSALSTGDPGNVETHSPFYINHAPTVASATTTVNNINPGAPFTVTATTSDTDVQGGIDQTVISVCSTAGWSTSTNSCVATTLCTSTPSTAVVHSCVSTTSVPMMHNNYPYYVYSYDWHNFSTSSNQAGSYNVNDVAPTVGSVNFNNGNNIYLNSKYAANVIVAASTTVTDTNGAADLRWATSTLYESATVGGYNCAANTDNCYKIASTSCSLTTTGSSTVVVNCIGSLAYNAYATDASGTNPKAGDNWVAAIIAADGSFNSVGTSSVANTLNDVYTSVVLDVSNPTIPFNAGAAMVAGADTGGVNATTTVVNFGNAPITTLLWGSDMNRSGGGTIALSNQKFATSSFTYGTGGVVFTATTSPLAQNTGISIARPITSATTTQDVYWGIKIPFSVTQSGDYTGINTFVASLTAGTWN
jgi:hypothetical protein